MCLANCLAETVRARRLHYVDLATHDNPKGFCGAGLTRRVFVT